MDNNVKKEQFFYQDKRLQMSFGERFLARAIISIFWALLSVLSVFFILMKESSLQFLGYLGIIFVLDRLANLNKPDKYFDKNFNQKIAQSNEKINLIFYCENSVKKIIEDVFDKTLINGGNFYLQLLNEFLDDKTFRDILSRLEINVDEFQGAIIETLKKNLEKKSKKELLEMINNLVVAAYFLKNKNFISKKDIFAAIFYVQDSEVERIKNYFRIEAEDVLVSTIFAEFRKQLVVKNLPETRGEFAKQYKSKEHKIMNKAWTARPTPFLDSISTDLTDLARAGKIGFLIGHNNEMRQLINILSKASNNNALLVGEPTSGIGSIVRHLAYLISQDEVPEKLFDKRLVMLSVENLISGATPQEITERVQKMVNEILEAGNVILFIPDIHNLFKTSGENYLSAAEVLLPILSKNNFQIIGSTTPAFYKKDIESRSDFNSLFEVIRVNEISEDEAITFLTYSALILEKQTKIKITYPAIKNAVKVAHRYFKDKMLPLSADDLLKEAVADVKNLRQKVLTGDDVIRVSQQKINVPLKFAEKEEAQKLLNLEELIHQSLIDQEEAVKEVSKALREYRAGLSRKGGPIATFLFIGPTGVGKTELSKILAKIQFGSENNMVRFDMSQYQDQKSIYDFVGSPDGSKAGILTEAVRQKPYCLILLDEFEKAHPDLLNLFLSVFDDGRLTDSFGRIIDFTNTIIIATSNAHSNLIKEKIEIGVSITEIADELKKRLTEYFKPELINRFSDIIVFKPLSKENIKEIARLNLKTLANNLKTERGIEIIFDETAVEKIAEIGFDPVYGARPLRNAISDNVNAILAEKILRSEIKEGDIVRLIFENGKFEIKK